MAHYTNNLIIKDSYVRPASTTDNNWGIRLYGNNYHATIDNNEISGFYHGINLEQGGYCTGVKITNNHIHNYARY